MRQSLKEKLKNLILTQRFVTYGEVCMFVAEEGYRVSTAERRLRELDAENVIMKDKRVSKRGTMYVYAYMAQGEAPKKPYIVFEGNKAVQIIPS